jgi:hypothetical protein
VCKKQQSNILCFLSILGLKNTQFYKDEIFIPQNPKKKKRKIKNMWFFSPKRF